MSVVVGKSMSRFLTVRWVNRGVNVVASPYNESYVDWMLHCWSVVVEVAISSLVALSRVCVVTKT